MKKKSMADMFYDACCMEYTLKSRNTGAFRVTRTGSGSARISSYGIESVGTVAIARVSSGFFRLTEAVIFTPTEKDAPILMMDYTRTLFRETLSVNIFKTQLVPLIYRQFSQLEEAFSKLPDAEIAAAWYNGLLISGSVAKKDRNEKLAGMLEEYLNAYLKVIHFAEPCKEIEKAAKTRELSRGFLDRGGMTAGPLVKTIGREKAEQLFSTVIFPEKR